MKALSCFVIALALLFAGSAEATGVRVIAAPRAVVVPFAAPVYAAPVVVQQQFAVDPYAGAAFAPAFAVQQFAAYQPFAVRTFGVTAFRSFGFRSRAFVPVRFAAPVRFGGFRR